MGAIIWVSSKLLIAAAERVAGQNLPQAGRLGVGKGVSLLVALDHVQVAVPGARQRQHLPALLVINVARHLRTCMYALLRYCHYRLSNIQKFTTLLALQTTVSLTPAAAAATAMEHDYSIAPSFQPLPHKIAEQVMGWLDKKKGIEGA